MGLKKKEKEKKKKEKKDKRDIKEQIPIAPTSIKEENKPIKPEIKKEDITPPVTTLKKEPIKINISTKIKSEVKSEPTITTEVKEDSLSPAVEKWQQIRKDLEEIDEEEIKAEEDIELELHEKLMKQKFQKKEEYIICSNCKNETVIIEGRCSICDFILDKNYKNNEIE